MKLTLDRMCIGTGKLCNSCKKLLDDGVISKIDIEIGKVLLNVAKTQKFLSNITLNRIIETSESIFLITNKQDRLKLIQAGDYLAKSFLAVDKRQVGYLEDTKNAKKLIEGILGPDYIIGTSTVFLPPFSDKELKIKIKKDHKNEILIKADELSMVTTAILGIRAHFAYV